MSDATQDAEQRWTEDWVDDRGRTHRRGRDRSCRDHREGIRHPAHEWEYARLRAGMLVIHYDCPGSTLGQYASRAERTAALREASTEALGCPHGHISPGNCGLCTGCDG